MSADDKTLWTLADALPVVRRLEEFLKPHGCHVALGGSVLHSGQSKKDLDVFIYPHRWDEAKPHHEIGRLLFDGGPLSDRQSHDTPASDKTIWNGAYDGWRIDLFFMLPSAFPTPTTT